MFAIRGVLHILEQQFNDADDAMTYTVDYNQQYKMFTAATLGQWAPSLLQSNFSAALHTL